MKQIFGKALLAATFLFNFPAQAAPLTFVLNCQWDLSIPRPATDPDLQIVKTVTKESGSWKTRYSLIAIPRAESSDPIVYGLEEASGDADYLVYKVENPSTDSFSWITIQNRFQWATIDTPEGTYTCQPQ